MSNLFPNAHGWTLLAVLVGAFVMAACITAILHGVYLLWMNFQPKKQMVCNLDEFEDKDCPFAVPLPYPTMVEGVRVIYFQSKASMYDWAQANIPDIHRRAQFTLETQHLHEYNDYKGLLTGIVELAYLQRDGGR